MNNYIIQQLQIQNITNMSIEKTNAFCKKRTV